MTANSEGFLVDQVSWEELKVGAFRFLFVSETRGEMLRNSISLEEEVGC